MPIDHSIYFQSQGPDIVGGITKGLSLKDMMNKVNEQDRAMKEQEGIQNAYKGGVVKTPDGKVTLDREKTLAGLLQVNPVVAYKQQFQWDAQDLETARNKAKASLDQIDLSSRLLSGVDSQESFDKALATAKQFGIDTQALGKYYDPMLVNRYKMMSLNAKEQLDQKFKKLDYELKQKTLGLAERKQQSDDVYRNRQLSQKEKQQSGYSAGQKKLDQDFAKDYNEWTSGKANSARIEIDKLQSVVDKLEGGAVRTGGFSGAFPDRVTSNDLLSARSDVQSTVMNSLKALLGTQFTEKEGERVIKNTWNEADSTQNNVNRLKRLISDLSSQADAKDQKARFYENSRGTLAGYKPQQTESGETKVWEGNTYKRIGDRWVKQ